jgi:hypothetical protein
VYATLVIRVTDENKNVHNNLEKFEMSKRAMVMTLVVTLAVSLIGVPSSMADEVERIDPSKEKELQSPDEDTERVTLTIKNTLDSTISIYWLDYEGGREYYHDIEPGKELDRSTFPGHYWVIVDSGDKALGIYKTPDEAATITVKTDELERIDPSKEKDLNSPEDTTRVELTIKNTLDSAISLYWLDYDGARVYYDDIEPGKELDRSTFPGHYWVIVDSKDKTLGIYETPDRDGVINVK